MAAVATAPPSAHSREGPKPRGEQRGLLRGVFVRRRGGHERGPECAHPLDDGVAPGAEREQPRPAQGGLSRAQPRKLPARLARRSARHGRDVGDAIETDALVGDAARHLGQRVGLVEHDGVHPPPNPEHAAAVPALGELDPGGWTGIVTC